MTVEPGIPNGALDRCSICRLEQEEGCVLRGESGGRQQPPLRAASRGFKAGATIFRQGDIESDAYIVLSGWVVLSKILPDGMRHNIDFVLPGDLLADWCLADSRSGYAAEAITDTELCAIPKLRLAEAWPKSPPLFNRVAASQAMQRARLIEHQTLLARRDALDGLVALVVSLFTRLNHRLPARPGEHFALPLTQTHLCDALGVTNVHISRVLRGLRQQGILQILDGMVEFLDPEAALRIIGANMSVMPSGKGRADRPATRIPSRTV